MVTRPKYTGLKRHDEGYLDEQVAVPGKIGYVVRSLGSSPLQVRLTRS